MQDFIKKILIAGIVLGGLPALSAVDQKYMPDGYVRDEYIRPYFVYYVDEYFKKVEKGEVKCNWQTYRKHVEKPIGRDMERIYMQAIEGLNPKD